MRARRAFTLIELLVTIGITGVLIGLTLSAVQAARESARRAQCAGNLRQIGLALASYASSFGSFPAGINGLAYSPHSLILPHLDQRPLYDSLNFSISAFDTAPWSANSTAIQTPLAVFLCPTDRSASRVGNAGWSSYAANRGVNRRTGDSDNGAFPVTEGPSQLSMASFSDGLSMTAALSEWVLGPLTENRDPKGTIYETPTQLISVNDFDRFAQECHGLDPTTAHPDFYDKGLYWHRGDYVYTNYNHILKPNDHSCMTGGGWVQYGAFSASSRHPGGINLLYADGHVRFTSESISLDIWRAIGTRNGGEVIGDSL